MHLQTTFELSTVLDNEKFHKVLSMADYVDENEEGYIDQSLASKGIVVIYRDSQYKKKVKFIVNSNLILDDDEPNPDKRTCKLEKCIDEYFSSEYGIDNFDLSGMVLSTDINVHSQQNVSNYLRILQRVGKVKGFSPTSYECFEGINSFCLEGNSNSIDFLLYDLAGLLVNRLRNASSNRKKLNSMLESAKGILRTEVRLTKPKAIRTYTNEIGVSEQISELLEKSKDIFLGTFTQAVPFGDFHKKEKAVELIRQEIKDVLLRRKMLQLVALIPEKKSLLLAQKALNYRRIDDLMKAFAKINLSPVTLSKRHDIKHLENLYTYLENFK